MKKLIVGLISVAFFLITAGLFITGTAIATEATHELGFAAATVATEANIQAPMVLDVTTPAQTATAEGTKAISTIAPTGGATITKKATTNNAQGQGVYAEVDTGGLQVATA